MPLHPVPIIIGTTLAVIGGGIAFKKFVYDPHVAPYIEAFIAAHTPSQRKRTKSGPIPIPLHSTPDARSSARRDRTAELRQRRFSNDPEDDSRQPLLQLGPEGDVIGQSGNMDGNMEMEDTIYRENARKESPLPSPFVQPSFTRKAHDQSIKQKYEEYSRPITPQETEIRQIFFDLSPDPTHQTQPSSSTPVIPSISTPPFQEQDLQSQSPLRSVQQSPHHGVISLGLPGQSLMALNTLHTPSPTVQPESTTFSFLSLSQASSPEAPNAMLASMTFSDAVDQWADVPRAHAQESMSPTRSTREEFDVMSLPETGSMSGYEDAEVYSPTLPRSPMRSQQQLPLGISSRLSAEGADATPREDRGPQTVREGMQGYNSASQRSTGRRERRPESVVSLSESEGWEGESDWEGNSEAGPR